MNMKKVRQMAYAKANNLKYVLKEDPIKTLMSISNFQVGAELFIEQEQFANFNLELDGKSCLGRVAQAAAIVEKRFPEAKIEIAEVWEDWLAGIMLKMLKEEPARRLDPTFMQELLMYEEPHLVLVINGKQFEPLSIQLGQNIEHPKIKTFPLWEGVTASVMVSEAWLEKNPNRKLKILKQAEKICPGLTLVRENMCAPLELLGRIDEVIENAKWALERRPCARTLYVLWLFTGNQVYYKQLTEKYTEEITKYF